MGCVSELLRACEAYVPALAEPADFDAFWEGRARRAAEPREVVSEPVGLDTPRATYRSLAFDALDGRRLHARAIVPASPGEHPCALVFHDMDRGPRGWFHLTRFTALDMAVVELERRPWAADVAAGWEGEPADLALVRLVEDALVCAHVAAGLPGVDAARLMTWGEGAGGALAVDVAALVPGVVRCAALNPAFADLRASWEAGASGPALAGIVAHFREADPTAEREERFFSALAYADTASFAPRLGEGVKLLMGCALMDELAPPRSQYAVYNRAACEKRMVSYPKYAHERINDFENRLLDFALLGLGGMRAPGQGANS